MCVYERERLTPSNFDMNCSSYGTNGCKNVLSCMGKDWDYVKEHLLCTIKDFFNHQTVNLLPYGLDCVK